MSSDHKEPVAPTAPSPLPPLPSSQSLQLQTTLGQLRTCLFDASERTYETKKTFRRLVALEAMVIALLAFVKLDAPLHVTLYIHAACVDRLKQGGQLDSCLSGKQEYKKLSQKAVRELYEYIDARVPDYTTPERNLVLAILQRSNHRRVGGSPALDDSSCSSSSSGVAAGKRKRK